MKKNLFFVTLIITLSLPLIWPFLKTGYFPTHDGEWAVVRLGAMHRAFIDHHFPVRWAGNLNFGYGYPLFHFTYPLPYYLGEIFNIAGFGLISSIELLFVISVVLSGIGMFLLAREFFGDFGGIISSVFYLYAPYRLVNLYVRGSLGESLSFALFPLLFWTMLKIAKEKSVRFVALFALLFGALLLTHNVSALLFTPFLAVAAVLFMIDQKDRRRVVLRAGTGFILGILSASFFLIPALVEKKDIVLSKMELTQLSDFFVSPAQLIMPSWGYGPFGTSDGLSVQIGWVHLIALIATLFLLFRLKNKRELLRISLFATIAVGVLIVLMLPVSLPFWQYIPLFSDVDFPWRVLGPAIFFLSLPLGFLATQKYTSIAGIAFLVIVIVTTLPYAKPQSVSNFPDDYYFTNEATTTSADELMPLWVREKPKERAAEKVEFVDGIGKVNGLFSNSIKTTFQLDVEKESVIWINTIYFPGWEVFIDGKRAPIRYDNPKGVIEFPIDKGAHAVAATFIETPLRTFADIVSLVTLLFIATLFLFPGILAKRLRFLK